MLLPSDMHAVPRSLPLLALQRPFAPPWPAPGSWHRDDKDRVLTQITHSSGHFPSTASGSGQLAHSCLYAAM